MPVHATKADYRDAFAGLTCPTSKVAILNRSRVKGGIDREVHAILSELPGSSYDSMEQLQTAVRGIYLGRGAEEDELPI